MSRPIPRDVDEVAVERACRGDRTVTLNRAEVLEAFQWMDAHGYSSRQIAARLGVTRRTVERWRAGFSSLPKTRPGMVA